MEHCVLPIYCRETVLTVWGDFFTTPPQRQPGQARHLGRVFPDIFNEISYITYREYDRAEHETAGRVWYARASANRYIVASLDWHTNKIEPLATHPTRQLAEADARRRAAVAYYESRNRTPAIPK